MRIPFSSLRFQDRDGRVIFGLLAHRWIARKNEIAIFPAIPPKWGFFSLMKPSQAREVILEGVRSSHPLYVTPYGLGGIGQSYALDVEGRAYERDDQPASDIGLDVKYEVAKNLTLDVTVNTDFAQVEADDQQVNLTRFSLFFPEKRLFFQERASVFDFPTGGRDNLFYSRRIGIAGGEAVPIYGGTRLIGRLGDWDLGILSMQTRVDAAAPSENFGVFRLRRRVLNENSYVGGIATTRLAAGGRHNVAYGLDGTLRLFGEDYLTFNWAQTFDDREEPGLASALTRARWERRTVDGFGYDLSATRVGSAYDPGVGFVQRTGSTRIGDRIFRGWIPGPESGILRHILSLRGHLVLRNDDRTLESSELGPEWRIEAKSGSILTLAAKALHEDLLDPFRLSDDAGVPAGRHSFYDLSASYTVSRTSLVRWVAKADMGSFYDGSRLSLGLAPAWSVSRHLEFTVNYQYDRIRFADRGERLDAHIARLRVETALTPTLSVVAFLQSNSAIHGIISNFRLRFNPREGSDLYVVYNGQLNTDRYRQVPTLPLTDSRTLLIKYSYTFTLGL